MSWHNYRKYLGLSCGWGLNILVFFLTISPAILGGYLRLFIADWVNVSPSSQG